MILFGLYYKLIYLCIEIRIRTPLPILLQGVRPDVKRVKKRINNIIKKTKNNGRQREYDCRAQS